MAAIQTTDILVGLDNHLVGDSTFNDAIGGSASTEGRLWLGQAPANETLPYAVSNVIDWVDMNAMDQDGVELRVQISVYVSRADATPDDLTDIVDDLLDRMQRTTSITIANNHVTTTPHFEVMRGPLYDDTTIRMDVDFLLMIMREA